MKVPTNIICPVDLKIFLFRIGTYWVFVNYNFVPTYINVLMFLFVDLYQFYLIKCNHIKLLDRY